MKSLSTEHFPAGDTNFKELRAPEEIEYDENALLHPPFSKILAGFIMIWYFFSSASLKELGSVVTEGYHTPENWVEFLTSSKGVG